MTAQSDTRIVPKDLINSVVPFKSQKNGPLRGNDLSIPADIFICAIFLNTGVTSQ